ncbi:MAG: hypothetical protein SFU98_03245 [Leptospiraceae bacterium]|nr:hypothetical protein [Leptospiraceae bacterium]
MKFISILFILSNCVQFKELVSFNESKISYMERYYKRNYPYLCGRSLKYYFLRPKKLPIKVDSEYCETFGTKVDMKNLKSVLKFKTPKLENLKYPERLNKIDQKYFSLAMYFYKIEEVNFFVGIFTLKILNYPKEDYSKSMSSNAFGETQIITDENSKFIQCTLFQYDTEYTLPIPTFEGKLYADLFNNECSGYSAEHEIVKRIEFKENKIYRIEFIYDEIRSYEKKIDIFDLVIKEEGK